MKLKELLGPGIHSGRRDFVSVASGAFETSASDGNDVDFPK